MTSVLPGMIVQLPHTLYADTVDAPEAVKIGSLLGWELITSTSSFGQVLIDISSRQEIPANEKFFWNQRDNAAVQLTLPLPPGEVLHPAP